jgi:hypothetical protein
VLMVAVGRGHFRIWGAGLWSSGTGVGFGWAGIEERTKGGVMKSRVIHVSIWKNGVMGSGLVVDCLLAH